MTPHLLGHKEQLIGKMHDWASEHATNSNGKLVALPYEPEIYPGQEGISVIGSPKPAGIIDAYAAQEQPHYKEMVEQLKGQENEFGEISRIGELLRGGNNVILNTNHDYLSDIAHVHAAFYSVLQRAGYAMKTGIIVSKMVAFLANKDGDNITPSMEALQILENETFLTYPQTESAETRGVGQLLLGGISRHNAKVRSHLRHRLKEGSWLLAFSPSGTLDKESIAHPGTVILGAMSNGTAKLMMEPHTYMVPVAVRGRGDTPVLHICDIPRVVSTKEVAFNGMRRIASVLTERVADKTYLYND